MIELQHIAVCVTMQSTCEKLIEAAHGLRREGDAMFVLHVARVGQNLMDGENDGRTLEYLYAVAHRAQADMTVLHAADIAGAIISFVRENDIQTLVLGVPPQGESALIKTLHESLWETCRILLVDKQKGVFI